MTSYRNYLNQFRIVGGGDRMNLDEGTLVGSEHGVSIYVYDDMGDRTYIVTRLFGQSGGDGLRVVHTGMDLVESVRRYETHRDEQRGFEQESRFQMVTNGS